MIQLLEEIIHENRNGWGLERSRLERLFFLKISGAQVTFLVFGRGEAYPLFVVKTARFHNMNWLLEKEYLQLVHFHKALSEPLRNTIPRPLFGEEKEGRFVLIQSGLRGIILPQNGSLLDSRQGAVRKMCRIVDQVKKWLFGFQQQTYQGEGTLSQEILRKEFLERIEMFKEFYALSIQEMDCLEKTVIAVQDFVGQKIPLVGMHGDFYIENFFFHGDKLSVFDWTFSEKAALPLWDPFMFASALYVPDSPKVSGDSKRNVLFSSEHLFRPQLVQFVYDCSDHWGIPRHKVPIYFTLFLVRMATRGTDEVANHASRNILWRRKFKQYVDQDLWERDERDLQRD